MAPASPMHEPDARALDFAVQPHSRPSARWAAERYGLRAVVEPARPRIGSLCVYDFCGDVLSLGRYHLAPDPPTPAGLELHRRHSGGRAVPFGDGFVGVSMVLPHRSALCAQAPLALAPYQVPNRYVRGILEGCKLIGVPAFYPGRDCITVNRRILGMVSFEVDPGGALLFEAIIANRRDFSVLPAMLDAVDPDGGVKAEMLTADMTTCLARELSTELTTAAVADLVRRGYEKQFGVRCEPHCGTVAEETAIAALTTDDLGGERWLWQRRRRPDLDRHGMERVQLGVLEVYFALHPDGRIKDIVLAGDFIADSAAIERLEADLRGCPAAAPAIDAAVSAVFAPPAAPPQHFILGIGSIRTITKTILKGLAA